MQGTQKQKITIEVVAMQIDGFTTDSVKREVERALLDLSCDLYAEVKVVHVTIEDIPK